MPARAFPWVRSWGLRARSVPGWGSGTEPSELDGAALAAVVSLACDLRLHEAEHRGDLAAGAVPVLRPVGGELQHADRGVIGTLREPGLDDRVPELFDLPPVFDQPGGAGERDPRLVGAQSDVRLRVGGEVGDRRRGLRDEEPQVAVELRLLNRQRV